MGFPFHAIKIPIPSSISSAFSLINLWTNLKLMILGVLSYVGFYKPMPEEEEDSAHTFIDYIYILDGPCPSLVPIPVNVVAAAIKNVVPVLLYGDFEVAAAAASRGCTICMEAIEQRQEVRDLSRCNHVFHRDCLDTWIDSGPAMATAMPNLAPGFIFFIAWAFRLEKVELGCKYSRAKIAGTLLCVIGAILMSLMQSTFSEETREKLKYSTIKIHENVFFDEQKIIGATYLMAAVLVLSSNIVLQAAALTEFPAPISLSATTSFIGAILTTIIQLFLENRIDFGWEFLSVEDLVGYSLLAGMISGGCVTFNTWAMKKKGPVLVSVFSPVGTLISVILSANTLQTSMSLGSLAGMFIMFTGLYFVLWAKGKEGMSSNSDCFTEIP